MSIEFNSVNTTPQSNKPNFLTRFVAPAVIGATTALGLGGGPAVAQEKPPENIPVQEEPKNEPKKDGHSCFLDVLIAYVLGRTFGYFHGKRTGSRTPIETFDKPEDIKIIVDNQQPTERAGEQEKKI